MRLDFIFRLSVLALAFALAACSSAVAPTAAPSTPTPVAIVPTHAPTIIPPTATLEPTRAAPTLTPRTATPEKIVWDYVALGDSNPSGFGVGGNSYVPMFANDMEHDLGVEVHLINRAFNGATSGLLLQRVQAVERVRQDIQNAEIVTIDIGANDWENVIASYQDKKCGGADNQDCLRALVQAFDKNFDGILDAVTGLQANNPTHLLRTVDLYTSNSELFALMQKPEIFKVVEPYIDEFNAHIEQSTTAHHGQVVRLHARFNGSDGTGNPKQFLQRDQDHLNPEGHKLVADMLRELGYK